MRHHVRKYCFTLLAGLLFYSCSLPNSDSSGSGGGNSSSDDGDIQSVALGKGFSLILDNDVTLWSVGSNDYGQLGTGDEEDSDIPVEIYQYMSSVYAGKYYNLRRFPLRNGTQYGGAIRRRDGNESQFADLHNLRRRVRIAPYVPYHDFKNR